MLISVTGCVSTSECYWVRPIAYEDSDVDVISPKLADSIVRHNAKVETNCPTIKATIEATIEANKKAP